MRRTAKVNKRGTAHVVILLIIIIVVLISGAGMYIWRQHTKSHPGIFSVSRGDYANTHTFQSLVFPNLPHTYTLVNAAAIKTAKDGSTYLDPSYTYVTDRSVAEANANILSICHVHKFQINGQPADNNGSTTMNGVTFSAYATDCYDSDNQWTFSVTESKNAVVEDWYQHMSQSVKNKVDSSKTLVSVSNFGPPATSCPSDGCN